MTDRESARLQVQTEDVLPSHGHHYPGLMGAKAAALDLPVDLWISAGDEGACSGVA